MKPTKELLVKQYINLIYYFAMRWVPDKSAVDDIVQETFRKAFMHYDSFTYNSEAQLKSWLLTICRNTVVDVKKVKIHAKLAMDEELHDSEINIIDQWLEQETKKQQIQLLREKMKVINKYDFDIIRMRFFDELPFKNIAEILNITEPTAKMRCYRSLIKLRKECEAV